MLHASQGAAHEVGAWVYLDAVHYAPHGPIDVRALECDFLACSAYKFFGPHVGLVYGKKEHMERLRPYKVSPAPTKSPTAGKRVRRTTRGCGADRGRRVFGGCR